MNFAPAGTTPFPVAAKVLPPNWGSGGMAERRGNSHTVTCAVCQSPMPG